MTEKKPFLVSAVSVLILTIASIKDGAFGISIDVSPKDPTIRVGQNFTFMCRVGKPLMYCRIVVPGFPNALSLSEKLTKNKDYGYEGNGLSSGQCGITINRVTDRHNGFFNCSLGFEDQVTEEQASSKVTVARPPQGRPDLQVTPDVDPRTGAYTENTLLKATCTVRDARPAATLSWSIGENTIYEGVGRAEVVESPTELYTVRQNLSRRLSWRDNGKDLRCVAKHGALESGISQTIKQISVRYPPRTADRSMDQFGFIIGEEGIVTVGIQANPKPYLTWIVGYERIAEGHLDSTQRFEATSARNMGNGTWEAQLRIVRVTAEDVDREYTLKARNDMGEQEYKVKISTNPQPPDALELGTGPIIGIVVAILLLLIIIFMLIFARATGRWCFSGGAAARHDNKESSDTESADHGPSEKSKKPKMNLTYILKKKKDKVAADADDLKLQTVAMEDKKEMEKAANEGCEIILTPNKGKTQGQDVVYAELDLQATQRPVVRREDDKTEYAEIIHTKTGEEGEEAQ